MTLEHDPKQLARETLIDLGHYPDLSERSEQLMLWACKEGPSEVVGAYLQLGMSTEIRDDWSRATPLIKAAEGNNSDIVRMLAEVGADLDARDKDGDTALHTATNWNNLEVTETLIAVGSPLDTINEKSESPLGSAIAGGNDRFVEMLLEAGASCDAFAPKQMPPLFLASEKSPDALSRLLEAGADVNGRRPYDGATLLMAAVAEDDRDTASALLEGGADITLQNEHGATAWMLAVWNGHDQMAEWLVEQGATPGDTEHFGLLREAEAGDFSSLAEYLDGGGDPDLTAPHGQSLLQWAVDAAPLEVLEMLLEAGAEPNDRPGHSSILLRASYAAKPDVVRRLLDAGAAVDTQSDFGDTALHAAASVGSVETVDVLIEAGADVEARRSFGESALHYAVDWAKTEIVERLLAAGADVDGANENGEVPLHMACKKHHTGVPEETYLEILEILLEADADCSPVSYLGQTPVAHARFSDNADAVRMLSDHMTVNRLRETRERLGYAPDQRDVALYAELAKTETAESLCEWIRRRERAVALGLVEAGVVDFIEPEPNVDPVKAAVETGFPGLVTALCEAGAPCDIVSQYGFSPLFQAIADKRLDCVEALIEAGVDLDVRLNNRPPVIVAAAGLHLELVELLAAAGCEIDPLPAGSSPLLGAAKGGSEELVRWLLDQGVRLDTRDTDRQTALYRAVASGHTGIVQILCNAGAELDVADKEQVTPLILAAKSGKTDIARILLEAGADAGRTDAEGVSARAHAAGRKETAAVFDELAPSSEAGASDADAMPQLDTPVDDAEWPAVLEAVYLADEARLVELIDQEAAVDVTNYRGDSALMVAVRHGHIPMIRTLCEAGAALDHTNDAGWSALSVALTRNYPAGLKELLEEYGAKISMEAIEGQVGVMQSHSDFCGALGRGDLRAVARLLDNHTVDIHLLCDGRTPLGIARRRGDVEMEELLLAKGARPDVPHLYSAT